MICAFFSFESPDPLVVVDSEGQLVDEAAEVFEICFQVVSSGADRFVVRLCFAAISAKAICSANILVIIFLIDF